MPPTRSGATHRPHSSGSATRGDSLRVLAHPLRSRLLAQLRVHGPATATALAAVLATNTGATSYHLRRLEEAGLVRDTRSGVGRNRVWAAQRIDSSETEEPLDEDEAAADRWLQHDFVHYFAERADSWVDQRDQWPTTWQDSCGLQDHAVLITTEQMSALTAELAEIMTRYRRIGSGSPGARRVAVYTALLPIDPR